MRHTERTAARAVRTAAEHDHAWRLIHGRRTPTVTSCPRVYRCDLCRVTWTT
jgi:hypothetical protein